MIDQEIRTLERAVRGGDETAKIKLGAARSRLSTTLEKAEQLLRKNLTIRNTTYNIENEARETYLQITGRTRLPAGVPKELDTLVARVLVDHPVARREREDRELEEQRGLQRELTRLGLLLNQAMTVFDRAGLKEALKTAQGTAKERTLTSSSIAEIVDEAREAGTSSVEADHEVAKRYRYPISYTLARAANLAPIGRDAVLVEIIRTQTWGSRRDTQAVILVPNDVEVS